MKTIDDALKYADTFDSPHNKHMSIVMLAAEVRRLRDEVNGLTGSLERAESVLQNLMSFLSVNGCRTEIDPENAELRIRDGINMLVRPALERAELAENALKEAQEQEPVAWINLNKWTPSNGPQCVTHEEYEKERELLTKLTAVYAAPVPAVAVPAIDIETILDASTATMCQCLRSRLLASEVRRLRALLQSASVPAVAAPAVQDDCVSQDESTMMMAASALALYRAGESAEYMAKAIEALLQSSQAAPSVPEEWREVMTELADDLAIEIDQSYPPERRAYPSEQRRYEREMEIVNRARALLQSVGEKK